jgi:hypothetical protein
LSIKAPPVRRRVAEANSTDALRGIARIASEDASTLGISFGDLIKLESMEKEPRRRAFVKAFFILPSEEDRLQGKVQIDSTARRSLDTELGEEVLISKADLAPFATSVTLEPFDPVSAGETEQDRKMLTAFVEDRPLWKGGMVLYPFEGKPMRLQVVVVEPESDVAIGTTTTKIILPQRHEMITRSGQLFAFHLVFTLKKRIVDREALWKALESRGFVKEEYQIGGIVSATTAPPDSTLLRQPGFPPQGRHHIRSPNIKRGRI